MIPHPSVKGYWQAVVINTLGGALACIEALHAWVCSRMQKDHPLCQCRKPLSANRHYPSRSILADLLGINTVLPYGRFGCKCNQEEIVGLESSLFLANISNSSLPHDIAARYPVNLRKRAVD